jgi:2-polyprenyl-6-methoxyphenol hydroxylase-like FAD-dependent oxidoreductase
VVAGYDVIVVGARVAGAATALQLAQRGVRVLAVDRAAFPSDTLSTHQVQVPGIAKLHGWGLLDKVVASNAPATRSARFDPGGVVLNGRMPHHDGVDALYSPRRTVLDAILVDAARSAGAEVRENFTVEAITSSDGRVTGIRGQEKGSARPVTESARLVVGADGKHSLVARSVDAPVSRRKPVQSMASYTYWDGVPLSGGEMYNRGRRAIGAWPTNDGLVMTYVAWPVAEFAEFRADVAGNLERTLDLAGDLGERIRAGRRVERIRATPDLPNVIRKPYGPGWALVGDAGLVMDPITGQGIGHALRDAEALAEAVSTGLTGRRPLDAALAGYERGRDRATRPMFDFTTQLAALAPQQPAERRLFAALAAEPEQTDRFIAALTGTLPLRQFMSPVNLVKLVGLGGFAGLVRRR